METEKAKFFHTYLNTAIESLNGILKYKTI